MKSRLSFTLVELLVVVAIIAVLAALLLPAMKSARERVKSATCVNNGRQIGAAMNAFLSDNNQWFPYTNPAWTYTSWPAAFMRRWNRQLAPYVGGENSLQAAQIFQCPANPWRVPKLTLGQNAPPLYDLNGQVLPGNWHDQSGVNPTNGGAHYISRVKPSDIPNLAGWVLTGETPYCAAGDSPWWTDGGGGIDAYPFTPPASSYWVMPWLAVRCPGNCHPQLRINHNLAWNSLMGDGHVERVTKDQLTAQANSAWNLGPSALWKGGALWAGPVNYINCPYPY